jgi:hypothetical protein
MGRAPRRLPAPSRSFALAALAPVRAHGDALRAGCGSLALHPGCVRLRDVQNQEHARSVRYAMPASFHAPFVASVRPEAKAHVAVPSAASVTS